MTGPTEQALRQATGGDSDALANLLEAHAPLLRRRLGTIPRRWRALVSVDDVMQQTYTDAFLMIERFSDSSLDVFAGWLVTRARRNLFDALRMLRTARRGGDRQRVDVSGESSSEVGLVELLGSVSATPSRDVARGEARQALEWAIERLPKTYRAVVSMYDLGGQRAEDVASALDRSVGAVYMLRSRAHERLSEILGSSSRFFST